MKELNSKKDLFAFITLRYNNINIICFLQPMIVRTHPVVDEALINDILPTENEDTGPFSSMVIPKSKSRNIKREARPIYGLILDILDTVYIATRRKGSTK